MSRFGPQFEKQSFVEESGFPPENVGFYLEAAKEVAKNEAELFFAKMAVPVTEEHAASMLGTALPLMLEFFGLLRSKCFLEEIEKRATREVIAD